MTKKQVLAAIPNLERLKSIAAAIFKYQGQAEAAAKTSREARCGGRTISLVNEMIKEGDITFTEESGPQLLLTWEQYVEKYGVENKLTIKDQSEAAAFEELRNQSASEGRGVILRWAKLGKAVEQAVIPYLLKKGWTLEDMANKPIHGILLAALQREELVEPLQSENEELRSQLQFYKRETSPAIRAKDMMWTLIEFLKQVDKFEGKYHIDITGTELVRWYDKLLAGYLTGKMPEYVG